MGVSGRSRTGTGNRADTMRRAARSSGTLKPGFICRIIAAISFTAFAFGLSRIMPLKEVKAGMRGIGKTVFADSKIEDFPVEILGVMENLGPKQPIILARLGGLQVER